VENPLNVPIQIANRESSGQNRGRLNRYSVNTAYSQYTVDSGYAPTKTVFSGYTLNSFCI
jgi:hypothetical protein